MSANIPDTKLVSELLKPTGFNCPADLEGKTFTEATSGGGDVELEDNKDVTINMSSYSEPVEVTPSEGKDAMKKVTVTLTGTPPVAMPLYAWTAGSTKIYTNFDKSPATLDELRTKFGVGGQAGPNILSLTVYHDWANAVSYTRTSDTAFSFTVSGSSVTWNYTRGDTSKDVVLQ